MKLAKLPDRTPVKMTVVLTPGLAQRLREYAVFYAETYGNKEDVTELIPFMLEAFLDGDPSFKRNKIVRSAKSSLNEGARGVEN